MIGTGVPEQRREGRGSRWAVPSDRGSGEVLHLAPWLLWRAEGEQEEEEEELLQRAEEEEEES